MGGLIGGLRWAVAAMFAAVIAAGLFVPVYTDEIGWRFQERAALDGVDKMYSELCGPNTLAVPPWFMWPARYYSAFFNTAFADPFWVRVSGIVYMLCWGVLLLALICRLTRDVQMRAVLGIVGLGLMSMANTPLILVLSRPEQTLVLTATGALMLAFAPAVATARQAWLRTIGVLVLAGIAMSYHVKGIVLAPLFAACVFFAARGRAAVIPRAVVGGLLVVMTVSAMAYWQGRLACPADAVLRAEYARNNTTASLGQIRDWDGLVEQIRFMLGQITIYKYIRLAIPEVSPLSWWLREDQITRDASFIWFLAFVLAWSLALLAAAVSLAGAAWTMLKQRRLDARLVLSLVLLGTVLAWSATQRIRNFYEAGWILPLLMLSVILALSRVETVGAGFRKIVLIVAVALGLGALASPVLLAGVWYPSLSSAARQAGYPEGQPNSVSVFGYQKIRPQIEAAAKLCRIPEPSKARIVLMDDVTYFHVIRSYLPQHKQGLLGSWTGELKDPIAYLKARRSSGVIVSCRTMPPEMRARAKRVGDFCCLGPPDWGGL